MNYVFKNHNFPNPQTLVSEVYHGTFPRPSPSFEAENQNTSKEEIPAEEMEYSNSLADIKFMLSWMLGK